MSIYTELDMVRTKNKELQNEINRLIENVNVSNQELSKAILQNYELKKQLRTAEDYRRIYKNQVKNLKTKLKKARDKNEWQRTSTKTTLIYWI